MHRYRNDIRFKARALYMFHLICNLYPLLCTQKCRMCLSMMMGSGTGDGWTYSTSKLESGLSSFMMIVRMQRFCFQTGMSDYVTNNFSLYTPLSFVRHNCLYNVILIVMTVTTAIITFCHVTIRFIIKFYPL